MRTDITSAIIGALITAAIGLVGWLLKKYFNSIDKTEIEKGKLENFYSPLYNEILLGKIITNGDALKKIEQILETKANFVPAHFSEWHKSYKNINYYKNKTLDEDVKKQINANYIWLRKKFHIEKKSLDKDMYRYLECYKTRNNIASIIEYLMWISPFALLMISTYYEEQSNIQTILHTAAISIFITCFINRCLDKWKD